MKENLITGPYNSGEKRSEEKTWCTKKEKARAKKIKSSNEIKKC